MSTIVSILALICIFGCSGPDPNDSPSPQNGFAAGKEYPVEWKGYVCADEDSLVKAKNAFGASGEFDKQPNCVRISVGDTLVVIGPADAYLKVRISNGLDRGTPTTGFSGLTDPAYLSK